MAVAKRTQKIHIRVRGQLDGAGGEQEGRMVIDPVLGVVTVRPYNSKETYTRSLTDVANFICKTVILGKVG